MKLDLTKMKDYLEDMNYAIHKPLYSNSLD